MARARKEGGHLRDPRAKRDAGHFSLGELVHEVEGDAGDILKQELLAVAVDIAFSGIKAIPLPITLARAVRWSFKSTTPHFGLVSATEARAISVVKRQPYERVRRNRQVARIVKEGQQTAKRRIASAIGGTAVGVFGAVRGGLALENPVFARHGFIVNFADWVISHTSAHEYFAAHNPAFLTTIGLSSLVVVAQATNMWLQTAKKRNYEAQLAKLR